MSHDYPVKRCCTCRKKRPFAAFHARKDSASGLRSKCKKCVKRYQTNRTSVKTAYDKQRYVVNRDAVLARVKRNYDSTAKAAYDRRTLAIRMKKRRQRYKTDINYRLICNLRSRLYGALKRGRKSVATLVLLGCTIEVLRAHLESLFTAGMSWRAVMAGRIQVDHIKPCASFDLTKLDQQRACFHYTNLQPLWKADNQRKYTKR